MLAFAASTFIAMASACGSDLPTSPTNVPGTYILRTIDGLSLPVTVPNPRNHLIVINAVTGTLNANDTYALAGTGIETAAGPDAMRIEAGAAIVSVSADGREGAERAQVRTRVVQCREQREREMCADLIG